MNKNAGLLILLATFSVGSTLTYANTEMNHSLSTQIDKNESNQQVLALLMTLNNNEIAAANQALTKDLSPRVKKYAKHLKKEHVHNLKQTMNLAKSLGASQETRAVMDLQQKGKEELAKLSSLNGKGFDKAYIDDMIADHQEALNLIDNQLLKEATNKTLVKHLKDTRKHIEQHLNQAKMIQAKQMQ